MLNGAIWEALGQCQIFNVPICDVLLGSYASGPDRGSFSLTLARWDKSCKEIARALLKRWNQKRMNERMNETKRYETSIPAKERTERGKNRRSVVVVVAHLAAMTL
ncbi:hypothetical protein BLOT_002961 [Blomia tropicalis]|nr:hypothetical protein BLOT_002961 [Blomia tropicalis]